MMIDILIERYPNFDWATLEVLPIVFVWCVQCLVSDALKWGLAW